MDDASSQPTGDANALPGPPRASRTALREFLEFLHPPRLRARGWVLVGALALLVWLSAGQRAPPFDSGAWIGGLGDVGAAASTFGIILQIVLIDLLLSGDNVLVIALACRRLPPRRARMAALFGSAGAIVLRVALTLVAAALMRLPVLKLLSALPLLVIALNLMARRREAPRLACDPSDSMIAAVGLIVVSDAIMSLDNVMALAAVSRGAFWLLAFGLALSIPLIVFGSLGLTRLMRKAPILADLGAAALGFVAGQMIADDPLIAGPVSRAPALTTAIPLACAVFVWMQGRWARQAAENE
jgi:YjbE family integral membrane protein